MKIFTKERLKYLSKRSGDFAGLILAAAIASDIFTKLPFAPKIIIILGGLTLFVIGFFCSIEEDKERR